MTTSTLKRPAVRRVPLVGNVLTVRIIVPEEYQPAWTRQSQSDDPSRRLLLAQSQPADPDGRIVLNQLRGDPRTRSGKDGRPPTVEELERRIVDTVSARVPRISEQDIVGIGHHAFTVIGGKLVGHESAEKIRSVYLSWSHQDVIVWTSDRQFTVYIRPVDPDRESAAQVWLPEHLGASFENHPFYRTDYPFLAQAWVESEHPRVFRVAAGPIRPDAIDKQYKVSFVFDPQAVDPDLMCGQ